MGIEEIGSFCPSNKQEWRQWLEANHKGMDAIWLISYKKTSERSNLSWSEAVDEALCFGWIDSVKLTIDDESYKQYYSKRKPNSTWSKVNKEKVACFIDNGRMKDAGLETIKLAKQNGSWTILDSVEALITPEDLKQEFEKHKGSKEYFDSRSKSIKKILLAWIVIAKREETRLKRIQEVAMNAGSSQVPKQFR